MKKPSGSAAAKQASSARPGFQPSAVAQFTAVEIAAKVSRPKLRARIQLPGLGGQRLQLPREITETALAHVIGDKAEQAYRRSDTLEKRRN